MIYMIFFIYTACSSVYCIQPPIKLQLDQPLKEKFYLKLFFLINSFKSSLKLKFRWSGHLFLFFCMSVYYWTTGHRFWPRNFIFGTKDPNFTSKKFFFIYNFFYFKSVFWILSFDFFYFGLQITFFVLET